MSWPTERTERWCRAAVLALGALLPVLIVYGASIR
jgi:hypothetical protein